MRQQASGTPSVTVIANGIAFLGERAGYGAPKAPTTVASGVATMGPLTASGSLNTDQTTASGVADLGPLTASGSPSTSLQASGSARLALSASGSPTVTVTAAGTAYLPLTAFGTPTTEVATAIGEAGNLLRAYSGTPWGSPWGSPWGACLAPQAIASGVATQGLTRVEATVTVTEVTASGDAAKKIAASGSASVSPTSSGTAGRLRPASGTPVVEVRAQGFVSMGPLFAVGNPKVTLSASGTAALGPLTASGTPQVTTVASGTAGKVLTASGTPFVQVIATGFAGNVLQAYSGTPWGSPWGSPWGACFAPTTTASGVAVLNGKLAYGNITFETVKVTTGVATNTPLPLTASTGTPWGSPWGSKWGACFSPTTTATGSARIVLRAFGSVTVDVTATGTADNGVRFADGDITLDPTTAAGTARTSLQASGTPSAPEATANGVIGIQGYKQGVGTATVSPVASGTAVVIKGFRRHMVPLRPMQPISSTLRPFLN